MATFFVWAILIPIVGIVWVTFIHIFVMVLDDWKQRRNRKNG